MASSTDKFLQTIGEAIIAYARVERAQSMLLGIILGTQDNVANVVFYAIQNVRARNEMIQTLLTFKLLHRYDLYYGSYWDSCSEFLLRLARFRNAVAHWHPLTRAYIKMGPEGKIVEDEDKPAEDVLGNPAPGRGLKSLSGSDIEPFIADCDFIRQELYEVCEHFKRNGFHKDVPPPDKFQQPIARQNQATLQRYYRRTKGRGRRPRSSRS